MQVMQPCRSTLSACPAFRSTCPDDAGVRLSTACEADSGNQISTAGRSCRNSSASAEVSRTSILMKTMTDSMLAEDDSPARTGAAALSKAELAQALGHRVLVQTLHEVPVNGLPDSDSLICGTTRAETETHEHVASSGFVPFSVQILASSSTVGNMMQLSMPGMSLSCKFICHVMCIEVGDWDSRGLQSSCRGRPDLRPVSKSIVIGEVWRRLFGQKFTRPHSAK